MRSLLCTCLWLLSLAAAGCWPGPRYGEQGDQDALRDPDCGGDAEPSTGGDGTGPRFSELMTKVFTPTCATSYCHQKDPPPVAPMTLEPAKAYAALVNVPSAQASSMKRVLPGDPARSYLIIKLRGLSAGSGAPVTQMPLNKPPLDEATIKSIEAWILRGAPND